MSRGFHLLMMNLAFYLLVIPIPAFNLRFVPVSAAPQWTGLGVQLAAGCLAVWARRNLAHHWSGTIAIKADQHLIQTGPYKTIRHPIYTAMLGMFAGATLVNGRCQALLASGIICFAYWRKIHLEEAALAGAFGPSYDVYKARAGALFPRW